MLLGFVVGLDEVAESELGFERSKLKRAEDTVRGMRLPEPVVKVMHHLARQTLCSWPVALGAVIPAGLGDRLERGWELTGRPPAKPTPTAKALLEAMRAAEGILIDGPAVIGGLRRTVYHLNREGVVRSFARVKPWSEAKSELEFFGLTPDADRLEAFLAKESRKKPAQALALMRLQAAPKATFTSAEIRALVNVPESTVRALLTAGLLVREGAPDRPAGPHHTLNLPQRLAADAIGAAIQEARAEKFLLFGVTGSGKTQVFIDSIRRTLAAGRQAIYLVPEIALATQAIAQLRAQFGASVVLLHSEQTPLQRLRTWSEIQRGEVSVVVGPRSALFAPMPNVGLVVVDEEHDGAYKQDSSPRYHAGQVAAFLADCHGCPAVFGSATPSLETFWRAESSAVPEADRYTLLSLPERATDAALPSVDLHDLTEDFRARRPALLSEPLRQAMSETIARGEQVILFLNRRAYTPALKCRDCGHAPECPNCAVSLSFHRAEGRLRCHHCDYRIPVPAQCPACGGERLAPLGIGTEKVEEAVRDAFPNVEVARLDRDVAAKRGALEAVLTDFRARKTQVLVGTQMVAKGLDFPFVTLVGVVTADISLNVPDFRSSERTFQLLTQVAGRAGRAAHPGHVIVQTFEVGHEAIKRAQHHDFLGFYEGEIRQRESGRYPPFVRLVNIVASGPDRSAVQAQIADTADRLRAGGFEVLGPADCPLERLNNRWRWHLLVKLGLHTEPASLIPALPESRPGVSVMVDVDAYSLM
jgi:primosomal protein N' (replication factor Y)